MCRVVVVVLLLIVLIINPINSLKCYISILPYMLNYSLTIDNIPSFDENRLVGRGDECTFTIAWLRNPPSSVIVFGYNEKLNPNEILIDSIGLSVEYQLEGEEMSRRLSHKIEYKCQLSDGCNNAENFHRVFKSFDMNENFSSNFDRLLQSNNSFNNQSIENCYLEQNMTDHCPSIDYSNCRRCQTIVQYSLTSLSNIEICGTCPLESTDYNRIVYEKIFVMNNRSKLVDQIELTCQNERQCNSLKNIEQIRQLSTIEFDFEKYFSSSSSSIHGFFFSLICFFFYLIDRIIFS